MACIVKLRPGCYIEWSKAADSAASMIMNQAQVRQHLSDAVRAQFILAGKALNSRQMTTEVEKLSAALEKYGTTDSGLSVDLDFILKYNSCGPNGETLTLSQIIKKYSR